MFCCPKPESLPSPWYRQINFSICFQLSSSDADKMGASLAGSKSLADTLKNLPHQELVAKSGSYPATQVRVPDVVIPPVSYQNLYERCRTRWARRRTDIERDIQDRQKGALEIQSEVLDAWQ